MDVLTFLQELLDKGLSSSTIKAYLAEISACYVTPGVHPLAILKGCLQVKTCNYEPIELVDMKFLFLKTALLAQTHAK